MGAIRTFGVVNRANCDYLSLLTGISRDATWGVL